MQGKDRTEADLRFLKLAISLGYRALGQTWPNPPVGCVLVKDGTIIGTGHTGFGGRPHAEANALKEASILSKGSTAYTTLEPCSHIGETNPCALELIKAGVKRVVCPLMDPDPRVNGRGFKLLEQHGITVDRNSVLVEEAEKLTEAFLKVREKKRPFIALKLALSLNGKIATRSNDSHWISEEKARNLVHFIRSRYDAIMVGKRTSLIDNPNLNLRGQFAYLQPPVKIILDRTLSLPKTSNFAKNVKHHNLIIVHDKNLSTKASEKWNETGVKTLGISIDKKKRIDLKELSNELVHLGLTSVLVEGGGDLATSLLDHSLVDLLILFTSGVLIEKDGINGFNSIIPSNKVLSSYPRFSLEKTFKAGNDVAHLWRPLNH